MGLWDLHEPVRKLLTIAAMGLGRQMNLKNKKITMKHTLFVLFLIPALCYGQRSGDKKIIFTISDSTNVHQQVKIAFVKNDFIVKENGEANIMSTYPRQFRKMQGYAVARAEIKGNSITIYGFYGLNKINDWGYTTEPKNYKPILYMKNGHGWKLLLQVVDSLNGKIASYSR